MGGQSPLKVVVAPILALVGLAVGAFITTKHFPLLVGDYDADGAETFGALSLGLLAAVVIVIAAGLIQASVLRSKGSPAYDRIIDASIR